MSKQFENLDYNDFRRMALDENLSPNKKIGFPEHYRQGYGEVIYRDILEKLPNLNNKNSCILDIGPGCSELPQLLIQHSREYQQKKVSKKI